MLSPESIARIDDVSERGDLLDALLALGREMGALHASFRWYEGDTLRRRSSLPEAWIAYYDASAYAAVDPGPKLAQAMVRPFLMAFDDAHRSFDATGRARQMFHELGEIDIRGALAVPVGPVEPTAAGGRAIIMFYTPVKPPEFDAWVASAGPALQLGATLIYERATRLGRLPAIDETFRLTERERDCLRCLAAGLRVDRIADKLAVSNRTVEFHIRNAREKLGARTREQAVAQALTLGEITL